MAAKSSTKLREQWAYSDEKKPDAPMQSLPTGDASLSCTNLWVSLDAEGVPTITARVDFSVHLTQALEAIVDHHKSKNTDASPSREKKRKPKAARSDPELANNMPRSEDVTARVDSSAVQELSALCAGMEERMRDAISALRDEQVGLSKSLQAFRDEFQTRMAMELVSEQATLNDVSLNRTIGAIRDDMQTQFKPVKESQDKIYQVMKSMYKNVYSDTMILQDIKTRIDSVGDFVCTLAESAAATTRGPDKDSSPSNQWSLFMGLSGIVDTQSTQLETVAREQTYP